MVNTTGMLIIRFICNIKASFKVKMTIIKIETKFAKYL